MLSNYTAELHTLKWYKSQSGRSYTCKETLTTAATTVIEYFIVTSLCLFPDVTRVEQDDASIGLGCATWLAFHGS